MPPPVPPPAQSLRKVDLPKEELSPERDVKQQPYEDDFDPLTTPPGMAKGVYITDDIDPLTPPPAATVPIPPGRRPTAPPAYEYLPFSSAYENQDKKKQDKSAAAEQPQAGDKKVKVGSDKQQQLPGSTPEKKGSLRCTSASIGKLPTEPAAKSPPPSVRISFVRKTL